jgi:hypothetical protein
MALIEARKIEGVSVYGVEQMSYTVGGVPGQDYTKALTVACFQESAAIEAELELLSLMVSRRQTKLKELGDVMAILSKAQGTMPIKDQYQTDLSEPMDALLDAQEIALKYLVRIPLGGSDGNQIQRRNCQVSISNIKHALDMETNSLQQDTVTLQNLIGKRDSNYQTASTVVKKALNASGSAIRNMKS